MAVTHLTFHSLQGMSGEAIHLKSQISSMNSGQPAGPLGLGFLL